MLPRTCIQTACLLTLLSTLMQDLFCQQDHALTLQNKDDFRIEMDTILDDNTELQAFGARFPISGLAISGNITFHSDTSLVRVILMDEQYNEYLVYEAYPILSGSGSCPVHEAAEETALLNNIVPDRVSFELVNASFHLKEFILSEVGTYKAQTKSILKREQILGKIERINRNLQGTGQTWIAGETSISRLSYQEKKSMFGGRVPNFQGFEYYRGGVFVLPGYPVSKPGTKGALSTNQSLEESPYPFEFSWLDRHGINWVTPVKNQGSCGSCVAFGTVAAAELQVNLYFNRKLDYDLSEQQILSCNGSCEGVNLLSTIEFIKNSGIVPEVCYPYTASDSDCSDTCSDPSERIIIKNWEWGNYSDDFKKRSIIQGATVGSINAWDHAALVVGYKTLETGDILYENKNESISIEEGHPLIGETAWIIKNSWGKGWGTDGFGMVAGSSSEIILFALHVPVNSRVYYEGDISCTDNDGDGYYYWGNGQKPSHCPDCPDQADGDDSNPCIGPMDEYGNLFFETPAPETKDTIILFGNSADLNVDGTNIRWYSDRELQDLVYTGNLFPTGHTEPGTYRYFVTQTESGCESDKKSIKFSLVTGIPPPVGHDTVIGVGKPGVITVESEHDAVFNWYEDPSLTTFLATGDTYSTGIKEEGLYTYYVTQTVCLIESSPDTVSLRVTDLVEIPDDQFYNALIYAGIDHDGDMVISPAEAEAMDLSLIHI